MGSLYNAKWFGSPVIVAAGQQAQGFGLTEPPLYDTLAAIAQPLVKWSIEVSRVQDLPRIVRRAAKIATTPPTGPVFLSLPGDVLEAQAELDLGKRTRVDAAARPSQEALERLSRRLLEARRPVILAGHEVATSGALAETARLAELLGAPVYQQPLAHTAQFPSEHPAFVGVLPRNQRSAQAIFERHDLLVALGAPLLTMSVPADIEPIPRGMPIVQIGERDWELGKNYPAEIALKANVRQTLLALVPDLERTQTAARAQEAAANLVAISSRNWTARREKLRRDVLAVEAAKPIDPRVLMMRIVEALPPDAVVVEEALTSAFSLLSFLPLRDPKGYFGLASGGIGFAMAGAVGVSLAQPGRPIVAIIGDGSAMYSIQALWTAAHLKLPIVYIIANNRSYRILKERLRDFRGTEKFIGMDLRDPELDFVALARGMGVSARYVSRADEIGPALGEAIAGEGPVLLDVAVADGFGDSGLVGAVRR
jgi:benzoylformate decarboxylase